MKELPIVRAFAPGDGWTLHKIPCWQLWGMELIGIDRETGNKRHVLLERGDVYHRHVWDEPALKPRVSVYYHLPDGSTITRWEQLPIVGGNDSINKDRD